MKIETGADIKAAREALGWSVYDLAEALRLTGSLDNNARRIREYEAGTREPTGPVAVAIEAFVSGFRPEGWADK